VKRFFVVRDRHHVVHVFVRVMPTCFSTARLMHVDVLLFALVRASPTCVRGRRRKRRVNPQPSTN
jgi:hypothetical protein